MSIPFFKLFTVTYQLHYLIVISFVHLYRYIYIFSRVNLYPMLLYTDHTQKPDCRNILFHVTLDHTQTQNCKNVLSYVLLHLYRYNTVETY